MTEHRETEQELRAEFERAGVRLELPDGTVEGLRADLLDHIANTELKTDVARAIAQRMATPTVEAMRSEVTAHINHASRTEPVTRREPPTAGKQPKRRKRQLRAAALAALAAVFAAIAIVPLTRPDPAEGAMFELAFAVYALPTNDFSASHTTFARTYTAIFDTEVPSPDGTERNIPVRFTYEEIRRYGPDASFQIDDTFIEATPLTDTSPDEQAFIASIFRVGSTETETYPPGTAHTDTFDTSGPIDDLRQRIAEHLVQHFHLSPVDPAGVLNAIESFYTMQLLQPSDRANLLEIIATTPGVQISTTGADLVTAAATYSAPHGFDARIELTFDSAGWLVETNHAALEDYPPWRLLNGESFKRIVHRVPTVAP